MAGWIWCVVHSLLTPVLDHSSQLRYRSESSVQLFKNRDAQTSPKTYRMKISGGRIQDYNFF